MGQTLVLQRPRGAHIQGIAGEAIRESVRMPPAPIRKHALA